MKGNLKSHKSPDKLSSPCCLLYLILLTHRLETAYNLKNLFLYGVIQRRISNDLLRMQ